MSNLGADVRDLKLRVQALEATGLPTEDAELVADREALAAKLTALEMAMNDQAVRLDSIERELRAAEVEASNDSYSADEKLPEEGIASDDVASTLGQAFENSES